MNLQTPTCSYDADPQPAQKILLRTGVWIFLWPMRSWRPVIQNQGILSLDIRWLLPNIIPQKRAVEIVAGFENVSNCNSSNLPIFFFAYVLISYDSL